MGAGTGSFFAGLVQGLGGQLDKWADQAQRKEQQEAEERFKELLLQLRRDELSADKKNREDKLRLEKEHDEFMRRISLANAYTEASAALPIGAEYDALRKAYAEASRRALEGNTVKAGNSKLEAKIRELEQKLKDAAKKKKAGGNKGVGGESAIDTAKKFIERAKKDPVGETKKIVSAAAGAGKSFTPMGPFLDSVKAMTTAGTKTPGEILADKLSVPGAPAYNALKNALPNGYNFGEAASGAVSGAVGTNIVQSILSGLGVQRDSGSNFIRMDPMTGQPVMQEPLMIDDLGGVIGGGAGGAAASASPGATGGGQAMGAAGAMDPNDDFWKIAKQIALRTRLNEEQAFDAMSLIQENEDVLSQFLTGTPRPKKTSQSK